MKAIFLEKHGGNDVLSYGERPDPSPKPGEVLVRVEAAALNRLDVFVRNGIPGVPVNFPHIPGADGAGVVEAVGEGAKGFAVGSKVVLQPGISCSRCEFCQSGDSSLCVDFGILGEHFSGTLAEKICVPAANVFPAPANLTIEEAAAFPLAALTAWRMLITRARLRAGETVLIHGIGGGVSTFALQIAKLAGAPLVIVTTTGAEKATKAKELGADVVLDYKEVDVGKKVREITAKRGVDVVVDSVGGPAWRTSLAAAAKKGRIVTCGATAGPNPEEEIRIIFWKQLDILGSTMGTAGEFRALLAAVGAGKIRPVVDVVFPLADARKAYERLEGDAGMGKVVLKI